MHALECRFPQASLFLSTDTAFSSCCTDFITAAHVQADVVVKFGFSCVFQETGDVPLYIVSWRPGAVSRLLDAAWPVPSNHIIFVDGVPHVSRDSRYSVRTWQCLDASRPEPDASIVSCHREAWVGELLCLLLPQNRVYQALEDSCRLEELSCTRARSRRWRVLSSLKTSPIYGIIVHSSLSRTSAVARSICGLLLSQGRQYYLINAGVLTPTKLGNYPDIDVFVIVGCSRLCFATQDFFKPVLTCFELLCQLGLYRRVMCGLALMLPRTNFWEDPYTLDTQRIESIIASSREAQAEESRASSLALYTERSLQLLQCRREQDVPLALGSGPPDVSIRGGRSGVPRSYVHIDGMSETIHS